MDNHTLDIALKLLLAVGKQIICRTNLQSLYRKPMTAVLAKNLLVLISRNSTGVGRL